jgi:hypothetical protein
MDDARAGDGMVQVGWIRRVEGRFQPDDWSFATLLYNTGYSTEEAAITGGWVPVYTTEEDYPWK